MRNQPVLIVGGGPVGLTLAIDLGQRGVACLLIDKRPRDIYERDYVLLRPDLHVAWRGNSTPEDPARLASVVTGHLRPN